MRNKHHNRWKEPKHLISIERRRADNQCEWHGNKVMERPPQMCSNFTNKGQKAGSSHKQTKGKGINLAPQKMF